MSRKPDTPNPVRPIMDFEAMWPGANHDIVKGAIVQVQTLAGRCLLDPRLLGPNVVALACGCEQLLEYLSDFAKEE